MLFLVCGGCDPTVETFEENELDYSIFGYLDSSADTQFVRVEPLRDGMLTQAPETLDVEGTLRNLDTDHTVALQDSLFRYQDGATAHNLYTSFPIEPSTTYRLRVQGVGEAESHVDATVPDSFPEPSVVSPAERISNLECRNPYQASPYAVVEIREIDRLVSVQALYYLDGMRSIGYLADTVQTATGAIRAQIDYLNDLCEMPEPGIPEKIEVMVAAGSPSWPDFLRMDRPTEMLPGVASNVEGGVGFLGGIVTDTVQVYPYFENTSPALTN